MTVSLWVFVPFIIAAVVLAWWRPRFVLLLPLVFHAAYLLRSSVHVGTREIPTTLLEVLMGIAIVTGVLYWRKRIVREIRSLPRIVLVSVAVFVVSATISAIIAPHPRTGWGHWKAFIVEPIAYAAVLLPLLRAKEGWMLAVRALLWGGVVSAGLSLASVTHCLLPAASCPITSDFFRFRGIYDVPNSLALVLAPLVVFTGALAFCTSSLRQLSQKALLLFVPALLLTQSIGGLLSAAFALLCITARKKAHRIALSIVLVLGVGVALLWASGRITHALADNSPFRARLQIWVVSLSLVREHPFLGTGLGTFEPAYQQKLRELLASGNFEFRISNFEIVPMAPALEWVVRDPHNIILSFWLNTGLFGVLSMGTVILFTLRKFLSLDTAPYLLAACAALITILVFGLADVPYMKNDLALLWWAYVFLALVNAED